MCNMKKRSIAVLLIIVMLLTLCCCGKKDDEDTSDVFSPDEVTTQKNESSEDSDPNTVKVTVPEGYTLLKISWLLEEKGVCTSAAFVKAVEDYDISSREILSSLAKAENICFKLEGYLFPATYKFKKGTEPKAVIDEMLDAFEKNFTTDMEKRAAEMGYSVHDILTVASIIEKEAFTQEQRGLVASTIYNRLNKNIRLEYDVTINYCEKVIKIQYPDKFDFYKFHYNGYRCDGLIAGPICNPGLESINAALYPDETNYLYFVIDTEEPHHHAFTDSYEQHQQNWEKLKNGEL